MTKAVIEGKLNSRNAVPAAELDKLFALHTQPYQPGDSFTKSDQFPLVVLKHTDPSHSAIVLKDKAYKDLRPWQWPTYTEFERQYVIENANNALTRLGYLDTHPLRRQIVEKTSAPRQTDPKKVANLGGGLLVSSHKKGHSVGTILAVASPALGASLTKERRLISESPRLTADAQHRASDKSARHVSPLKRPNLTYAVSLSLSLSSEDEKLISKTEKVAKRYSNTSTQSSGSLHSNSNSYTLPSSVNEDNNSDEFHPSEDEAKLLPVERTAATLPSRPGSSVHDKKHQYYVQLADKFKQKYHEYAQLHQQLAQDSRRGSSAEKKKGLMKLYQLHGSLSEWKKKIWDYHNENHMAEEVMHLAKHRKTSSRGMNSARGGNFKTGEKAKLGLDVEAERPRSGFDNVKKLAMVEHATLPKPKLTMNY